MKMRNAVLALAISLSALTSSTLAQPRFEIPLTVTDGTSSWTLYFGILPGANFCIATQDSINGHGESFLPPGGAPGVFVAAFGWPRSGSNAACFDQGTFCDYRPFTGYTQRDTFRVNIRYPNALPVMVSWPSDLSTYFRQLVLKDVTSNGTIYNVNMLTTTSVSLDIDPADVRIYAGGPHTQNDTSIVQVQIRAGWNVISNPFDHPIPDNLARHLYSTLIGQQVFGYNAGYYLSDQMLKGRGYWGKFPAATTVTIRGTGYTSDSVGVSIAWNIIGPVYYPVPVSAVYSVPPNIIGSHFFELKVAGYATVDTLWPGKGYFVKMLSSGLLVLPDGF